mmetsp:Transcript_37653/g.117333  ORF Transcript_37653/g.117333 Transcript_37653/m.117333 type:complete len:190 (+) Transcript_37653:51-620(+)|eukprot:CAMPEP_0204587580 /NCGR_PEP_ID=MMETSP0661-20131031/48131_1 /ASSEMBLY_ACC=CAM_ASM_000606 /TAXON_ID=109239 /ORGANISM="Alexandrium margalefi, Strain AMGDE01CS-322" /LENGTH=189 /DNA_ID=CAMNT_0051597311 /DNA_START=51 /DNA_END=620 /DNA_ORIENTATION=+
MPASHEAFEGRIPGFNTKWNIRQMDIIGKEDKLRWQSLDKQQEMRATEASGKPRKQVTLPRAHSCIGPYPGCRRLAQLSPRKSAAVCFLEQKLLRSSSQDPLRPTVRERLYEGVSHEEQGRHAYLNRRYKQSIQDRYGGQAATSSQEIGFRRPEGEYRASVFCHKPVIEGGFYRTNGVVTYDNLPSAAE